MFISLKDNQYNNTVPWDRAWKDYDDKGEIGVVKSPAYEQFEKTLQKFNRVSLTELAKPENKEKYGKFLVFPSNAAESDLDTKDKVLFELLEENTENPKFRTGNVMGFFTLRGEEKDGKPSEVRMQITSRFDDEAGKDNFFLHYMLQKVCNMAIAPSTSSGAESFYDFLPYLFPSYLKEACKQGIFRAYVTREYNDANVRGPIDVARHIRYNIPFNGKVAYHTREYSADNKITQLVRHTIEYIRSMGFSILDGDARDDVGKIIAATPTYTKNDRAKVIAQNLHPVTHPYYTAYEPLRMLCLGILQHKKLSYGGDDDNQIAGILFDGASLWEEYLAKVFEDGKLGLIHSNNRIGDNGIQLLEGGRKNHYPDFYRENDEKNNNKAIVLDAKYKNLCRNKNDKNGDDDNDEMSEELGDYKFHILGRDVMQMLAYMYALKAQRTILISPYVKAVSLDILYSNPPKKAMGYGGEIGAVAVPIPCYKEGNTDANWLSFEKDMKSIEENLVKVISEWIKT